eukprot:TRINITY_DN1891_c0_g2_i1.p1 TRINITY_DN1891_c0_g2~~TRINITY_DN1891_c0_g2_i1.p1  ORF type:complete len:207 (-),score=62.01 TRINITY_DN1891_c0_g2_i1:73-663(-)
MDSAVIVIVTIGDSAVGKTSILRNFISSTFTAHHVPTVGVDFKYHDFNLNGQDVKLQIWDTAGQKKYQTITTAFYHGAHGIVVAYDVTRASTFENVQNWLDAVEKHASENVELLLIGNKTDLDKERQVTTEEGLEFATERGISFIETSAQSGENVLKAFELLGSKIVENRKINPPDEGPEPIPVPEPVADDTPCTC